MIIVKKKETAKPHSIAAHGNDIKIHADSLRIRYVTISMTPKVLKSSFVFLAGFSTSVFFIMSHSAMTTIINCSFNGDNHPAHLELTKDLNEQQPDVQNVHKISLGDDNNMLHYDSILGEKHFYETANLLKPLTDKVTDHSYQVMYGRFLLPFYRHKRNMKMLEIGLGCDMSYGPGASIKVWEDLFPGAEKWVAEYDSECVNKWEKDLLNIKTLVGDQGDPSVLDQWIEKAEGKFDVIIDDGGHDNCQIWTSFLKLWPTLNAGGLYFIEDIHVARKRQYKKVESSLCKKGTIVPNELKSFLDKLIYDEETDIEFMFCQREACVLGKKK